MQGLTSRLGAVLLVMVGVCGLSTAQAATTDFTIYTDNYAADEIISRVAADVLAEHYDADVSVKPVSVGVAFMGTAWQENSVFLAAWLPRTHGPHMKRVKGRVDELGWL